MSRLLLCRHASAIAAMHLDIICSSKHKVFLELRSRKSVRFPEQITSSDKYSSIFSRQMEIIVYIYRSLVFALGILFL